MKRQQQNGSAALLSIFALLTAAVVGIRLLGQRAEQDLRAEYHNELVADRMQVKSAMRVLTHCKLIDLSTPCTAGSTMALKAVSGANFIAADGSSKIGKWNVKAVCLPKAPNAWWIQLGVPDGKNGFQPDPMTKLPLEWKDLMSVQQACTTTGPGYELKRSDPCYGAMEGVGILPGDINSMANCNNCKLHDFYCADNQREYPLCPTGFQTIFHYADRYGWGGMDLTKYTLCTSLL